MDITKIKRKANSLYIKYKSQIIPQFFYVGYITLLAQYLQSGLFSFFVSLFLSPIGHGYVKCTMKLVDEEHPQLDYHDSMIGIFDFARVLPAYFMRKFVIFFVTLLFALPLLLKFYHYSPEFSVEWFSFLGEMFIQMDLFIPDFAIMALFFKSGWVVFNIIVCTSVYLLLSAFLMPVPYIMQSEDFSWSECIQYSFQLMKGHIIDCIKLYFSYFIRNIAYWFLTGTIIIVIGRVNDILMLFCFVYSLLIYIDIVKGRFEIAKYLFYKEMSEESV